ncbi:dihydropteroate synthase [Salidesulfovibrio brasiliensis]|uniref:dihydropteroate synthase n=1 Tax=Salidesulfovibrio brasiliensis TaxID=221711 RepID=UPI0006D01EDA|nr:dihydropteroate synthase [Salidesulfovibrio brasiliensis]
MTDTIWTIQGGRVLGPAPFFIAGIVNVTPDSFYDGGSYPAPETAVAHARQLVCDGATILDIGGESTRPYADPVDAPEELDRIMPVIRELAGKPVERHDCIEVVPAISVDTYKAGVAATALDAGADIINDVSAFEYDPELLDVLGQYKPGYVLMHSLGRPESMQDAPRYDDPVEDICRFFERKLEQLDKAGVPSDRIVLDPGIGFGKLLEHNLAILAGVERFTRFGLPVFMGLSNKSLWQGLLGLDVGERGNATQVGTAATAMKGAAIHRVHDVRSAMQTLTIVHALA